MKIVYSNVIWILSFAAYNYLSLAKDSSSPVDVDIAAFFDEEDLIPGLAFRAVVSTNNKLQNDVHYRETIRIVSKNDILESSTFLCRLMEEKTLGGIFCPSSQDTAAIIESTSVSYEIPVIQIGWRPSEQYQNQSLSVNFFPYQRLLFQGLGVVVKNLQWRSFVIFYETTENLIAIQDILKAHNYDPNAKTNTVILKELGPGPDYRSALKQIYNKTEHRIILDCKTENILTILKQAKEVHLLEPPFSYFLTSLDAHTLNLTELNTKANITTVRIIKPEDIFFKNFVKRLELYASKEMITLDPYSITTETAVMYDAATIFMKSLHDVHIPGPITPQSFNCHEEIKPWNDGLRIAAFIRERKFGADEGVQTVTGPIMFDEFGRRVNFNIYIVEGNREEVLAIWNPQNPNHLEFTKSEEDRNKELERKWRERGDVIVASIKGPPYLRVKNKTEEDAHGPDEFEGFSVDLMKRLGDKLNITFKFQVRDDTDRGKFNSDTKSWTGLIGDILERRAELAICDLTITPERREVVDFSAPFMRLGISILYKKPEAKPANMYAFMAPLSLDLWLYSATIYLAISVVLFFIARASSADWENPHPCDQEPEELENIWNIKNCLWLTLGSIMNQGCDILPKGFASRMVAAMWWFYAIIVTNSYMANLAAFLTNERSQDVINSAEDLAKQTKVKYGTMEGGSTESFFRTSNYSVYQRMWTQMSQSKPSVFEKTNPAGVTRVQNTKNSGYAFLMESGSLEYEIQTKCDLMQVGNWLDSKGYGIAMPLDYPHRSRINKALLNLQEEGVINELKEKWWVKKQVNRCSMEPDEGPSNKLALQNVGGVFVVLVVGVALAYVAGICEFLWHVRNVSVEEHITFKEALKAEIKFALNVTVTKKRVKPELSESSSRSSESRSMGRSILQGAGSFLRLDVLSKHETPGSSRHTSRHSSRPLD